MRVVVWNARGLREEVDAAEAVGSLRPDLVLLTECGRKRALDRFSRHLGMDVVAAPHPLFRRAKHNAILFRDPWRPATSSSERFGRSERLYPRGATVARLRRPGSAVTAIAVHLGLSPGERVRHARELTDTARSSAGSVLIGGDLNEGPDGGAVRWISGRFWDCWSAGDGPGATFPANDPVARIDYLFVSEGAVPKECRVPDDEIWRRTSDHLPLVVDLDLPEG